MERLTTYRKDGRAAIANKDGASPLEQTMKIPAVIDRLAAFEDIGHEPEELVKAMEDCGDTVAENQWAIKLLNEIGGNIDRLRELAEADKDGRLVVLSDAEADALKAYREGRMEIKCQGCWPVDAEAAERPKCFYNDNGSPLCLGLAVGDDDYPIEKCQKCWYSEYASVEREGAEATPRGEEKCTKTQES